MQTERVAAWRELARRLAHELKNPLFPLQLTVENLVRARDQSPEIFEEIFRKVQRPCWRRSAILKTDHLAFQRILEDAATPTSARDRQRTGGGRGPLVPGAAGVARGRRLPCKLELAASSRRPVAADAELLHRALSNLVLNAMDAMPHGGTLTLRTRRTEIVCALRSQIPA